MEIWNAFVAAGEFYMQLTWPNFERAWIKQKFIKQYGCIIFFVCVFRKALCRGLVCTESTAENKSYAATVMPFNIWSTEQESAGGNIIWCCSTLAAW